MLKRLQFSKDIQTAIKASELLTGKLTEDKINGGFLTAVLKNDFNDAIKRANDHNLSALNAKEFTVNRFMFINKDKYGYITGEKYYLKLRTINGQLEVTPSVDSDGEQLIYPDLRNFLFDFNTTV